MDQKIYLEMTHMSRKQHDAQQAICDLQNKTILRQANTKMTDWSEPYLKLEQSHKALKDALNQDRYEDAEELIYDILDSTDKLLEFICPKIES